MEAQCLITLSEFSRRVYGKVEDGATPPCRQTLAKRCHRKQLPAQFIDGMWYVDWNAYQKLTGNALVNKILLNVKRA